jgi:hypothetical protein
LGPLTRPGESLADRGSCSPSLRGVRCLTSVMAHRVNRNFMHRSSVQGPGSGRLPSTHWEEVQAAANLSREEGRQAMERLLVRYRPPLLVHLSGKFSFDSDRAADVFQDFLHEKLVARQILKSADRKRGRFRTFLLNALDNYVVSRLRQGKSPKRKPAGELLPLEAVAESALPSHVDRHDHRTEVVWGQAVIAGALLNMLHELKERKRDDIWAVFEGRVLRPLLDDRPALDYDELARHYGYKSPAAAFNVLVTAKRMFKRHLRAVIAEYAKDDRRLEDELSYLRRVLED